MVTRLDKKHLGKWNRLVGAINHEIYNDPPSSVSRGYDGGDLADGEKVILLEDLKEFIDLRINQIRD